MTFNLPTDPNAMVIAGLTFLVGLLIGLLLVAGTRRKWRNRYEEEVDCRESWQAEHDRLQQKMHDRETELRERDSRRESATEDRELELTREHERTH